MVAHMVSDAMRCLNQFPWAHSISATMSPNAIVTGATVPDFNHVSIKFGTSLMQLFEDNTPSNTSDLDP